MEILDVYNESGKVINKTVLRNAADSEFMDGEHIAIAIIFIENDNGEFLIQKLPSGKYSSTGGHILTGEKPIDAIIRETKEEIGVTLDKNDIIDLGFRLYDFPLRFLYYTKKNINLDSLVLDKNEVVSVEYMNEEKINKLIHSNEKFNSGHIFLYRDILKYKYGIKTLNDVFLYYKEKCRVKFNKNEAMFFTLFLSDYDILIADNSIQVVKQKKLLWIKYNDVIESYKDIKDYEDYIKIVDILIDKYERK